MRWKRCNNKKTQMMRALDYGNSATGIWIQRRRQHGSVHIVCYSMSCSHVVPSWLFKANFLPPRLTNHSTEQLDIRNFIAFIGNDIPSESAGWSGRGAFPIYHFTTRVYIRVKASKSLIEWEAPAVLWCGRACCVCVAAAALTVDSSFLKPPLVAAVTTPFCSRSLAPF